MQKDEEWKHFSSFQTVDKTNRFRQYGESFRPPFSKGGAVKGAEPLSPSAEGEIPLVALFFCKLFFCAYMVKRKATNKFVRLDKLLFLQ